MLKEEFEKRLGVEITQDLYCQLNKIYEEDPYEDNVEFTDAIKKSKIATALLNECNILLKENRVLVEDGKDAAERLLELADLLYDPKFNDEAQENYIYLTNCIVRLLPYKDMILIKLRKGYHITADEKKWILNNLQS